MHLAHLHLKIEKKKQAIKKEIANVSFGIVLAY
jgi:hypothetical protein